MYVIQEIKLGCTVDALNNKTILKHDLTTHKIGTSQDWKFGLITREIYRIDENTFEINDTSDGWASAIVSKQEMTDLLNNQLSLLNLNWK